MRNSQSRESNPESYSTDLDSTIQWIRSHRRLTNGQYIIKPAAYDYISSNAAIVFEMLHVLEQAISSSLTDQEKDENISTVFLNRIQDCFNRFNSKFNRNLDSNLKGSEERIEIIISDLTNLLEVKEKYRQLQVEHEELQIKHDSLSKRLQKLYEEKGETLRDKETTVQLNSSRPKDFNISKTVNKLGGEFLSVSEEVYNLRVTKHLTGDIREREIGDICAILSRKILLDFQLLLKQGHLQELIAEEIQPTIDAILLEAQANQTSEDIESVHGKVRNLVRKGYQLVTDVAKADPPGELFESEEAEFDGEKHEIINGCNAAGQIKLTVYPGYRLLSSTVHQKPIVSTLHG